ncbi:SEC12-like protein 1 [Camellia lanceoleosa]|uniref:SEC12-like protein 1 n=1 Tax=Camellia lanceoleosa TaxID=1840588 RepID=A0ACC0FMY2_9ERIC|nr:SEC12-like protein 1 [Camellia lanceoleosa]
MLQPLLFCLLDSEFLATTSTDGSARIWKTNDGVPLTSLTRNPGHSITKFCLRVMPSPNPQRKLFLALACVVCISPLM